MSRARRGALPISRLVDVRAPSRGFRPTCSRCGQELTRAQAEEVDDDLALGRPLGEAIRAACSCRGLDVDGRISSDE